LVGIANYAVGRFYYPLALQLLSIEKIWPSVPLSQKYSSFF